MSQTRDTIVGDGLIQPLKMKQCIWRGKDKVEFKRSRGGGPLFKLLSLHKIETPLF